MPVTTSGAAHPTERLWHAFRDRLRAFILPRVRQASDAEDVLQEVFLRIHRTAASLEDPKALTAWVYRITRNAIVDHHRSARRNGSPITEQLEAEFETAPGTEAEHREFSGCLHPMIQDVPEPYREALVLTELQGLPQAKAAAMVGVSLPAMKSRVQRGRRRLKDLFLACCRLDLDPSGGVRECSVRVPKRSGCGGCPEPGDLEGP